MDRKPSSSSPFDKRDGPTFKFVNIERPGDATNERVRRQVRSHVSRLQHRQNRERQFHQAAHLKGVAAARLDAGASSSLDSSEDGRSTVVAPADVRNTITSWTRHSSTESDSTSEETAERQQISPPASGFATAQPSLLALPSSVLEKSFSRGSLAFRTISLNDPDNIIGRNVAELKLDLSSIMSFYRMIAIIQAQDFDQQYGVILPGVTSWKRFYAFVFTDPVVLTTAILLTSRHQFEVLGREASGEDGVRIANMERFLLQRINEALRDPVRGISDQMLVAVALYAAYEIKHGNGSRYHIHMSGLVQMINLRGGLREISQQDPYVERLLLWQDANTSKLANIPGYLIDLDNSLGEWSKRPKPNPRMFQLR
jgi:hypothetical protein